MAVPVGRKVYITLRSADVIHAFYVPRFLFKRDVVPGMENHFEFTVDEAEAGNTFHGQCAELCGIGHRAMLFSVTALTQSDFDAWLAALVEKANATPPPLPSGPALNVTAKTFQFDKKDLEVPAGVAFGIVFKNDDDPAVTHDLDVRDSGGTVVENQDPIAGGTSANYAYTPLEAGTYTFFCSIHANMTGTLTVK
jgi:heme/copper-type cytochrome/quinol oxidase subunit 2